jgi:hypothetical protein
VKGYIVVSSSRLFLTHRRDSSDFNQVSIGWTKRRKNALRYASRKQAKKALGIYPMSDSTVEPAQLLSKIEIVLLESLVEYEGVVGPQVSVLQERLYEGLQKRGFVFETAESQWEISALGKAALREVTS